MAVLGVSFTVIYIAVRHMEDRSVEQSIPHVLGMPVSH